MSKDQLRIKKLMTRAIAAIGMSELAARCKVTPQAICNVRLRGRVSPDLAIKLEAAQIGVGFTRSDWRPDLWPREKAA